MTAPAESNQLAALQMILAKRLRQGLEAQEFSGLPVLVNIPLTRVKSKSQIRYVSAVALKLLPSLNAMSLAQQIAKIHQLPQPSQAGWLSDGLNRDIEQALQISIAEPGWLYLDLSSAGLANWLQYQVKFAVLTRNSLPELNQAPWPSQFDRVDRGSEQIFLALHSHARCRSILRAADVKFGNWQLAADSEQFEQLLGTYQALWQAAEWQLVEQLIDVIDDLALAEAKLGSQPLDSIQISKLAYQLSCKFQAFYAASLPGILAQDHSVPADLHPGQLGLVLLTQRLLWLLLDLLNLPAPDQL